MMAEAPMAAVSLRGKRRARYEPRLGFEEYLRCLAALDPPSAVVLRAWKGPSGAPFALVR